MGQGLEEIGGGGLGFGATTDLLTGVRSLTPCAADLHNGDTCGIILGTCCDGTCYSMIPWDTSPLTCNRCKSDSQDGDDCVFKQHGYTQWGYCYHGTCMNECCIPVGMPGAARHSSCAFVGCS